MNLSDSIKNLKNKIEDINNKVKNLIKLSNLANAKAKDNETKVENAINTAYNNLKNINEINNKIEALKYTQSLAYEGAVVTCENTLASRTSDMIIKGNTYQNASVIESAGENENKIIILSNNNKPEDDIDYKEYKKEISLPIEGGLKLLHNGVYDTIEQRNDGVYLVQRVGKIVLNGSEAWTKSSWSMTNTFKFDFEIGLVAKLFDINATNQILCDTFKVVSRNSLDNVANREFENICASNSKSRTLSITISKTKLNNTNTIDTFKQWLRNNPVTVCYELATPIETKLNINNLDLEVYEGTTYVTTDNAIKPALSFKVPSNIGGVMQGNAQNVNKLYKLVDDTQTNADIADLDTNKQDKTDNALDTTDKTVVGAINEVNGNTLDNITFSADYKNIIINRKSGLNPYTIPISAIIHNAKLIELNDVDSTNIGDGKTLIYDSATKKHKYVDSTGTDELVKMDSATDAKHLSELIDKSTIVNDNGVLKVKKLDGQEVTIAEINHLKGLTMNVMDLVNSFANGGVKVYEHTIPTYADLSALDRSGFIDGIKYFVYVQSDETHGGAKTTYLCDKKSTSYFCVSGDHRDFTTNPIDLVNEVTGKLGTSNIDVDALWKLLTINDTYKTLTAKNEVFGTHGAKALYDELVTSIGKKANSTDLTTHTGDTNIHVTTSDKTKWNKIDNKADKTDLTSHTSNTDIHITTAERTKWNNVDNKVDKTNIIDNLTSTDTNKPLSANQGKVLKGEVDKKANDNEVIKKTAITTTINSASTDSQVPSSKRVWDSLYKIIDPQVLVDANKPTSKICEADLTTLNTPSKEGLTKGESSLIISVKNQDFWNGQISITMAEPEVFVRSVRNAGTWTKWQRLCTTSVADVPVTNITPTLPSTVTLGKFQAISYSVKNGWANVSIVMQLKASPKLDWTSIATGLPKSDKEINTSSYGETGINNNRVAFRLKETRALEMLVSSEITQSDWWNVTFSYPVAEE